MPHQVLGQLGLELCFPCQHIKLQWESKDHTYVGYQVCNRCPLGNLFQTVVDLPRATAANEYVFCKNFKIFICVRFSERKSKCVRDTKCGPLITRVLK